MNKIRFCETGAFRQIAYNNVIHYDIDKNLFDKFKNIYEENQKLRAELNLYQGALEREHEAIHRANDLEEEKENLIKYLENELLDGRSNRNRWLMGYYDAERDILKKVKEGKYE